MADPLITDDATLAGDPAVTEHPVAGAGPGWPARLGHYVMLQELGRGGMGIVCRGMLAADDPQLEPITAWSSEHQ